MGRQKRYEGDGYSMHTFWTKSPKFIRKDPRPVSSLISCLEINSNHIRARADNVLLDQLRNPGAGARVGITPRRSEADISDEHGKVKSTYYQIGEQICSGLKGWSHITFNLAAFSGEMPSKRSGCVSNRKEEMLKSN